MSEEMSEDTLYERLGGRESIVAVVDEFYDRVMADERVNYYFEDVDMTRQRAHQAQFISSVTGGPVEYTGEDMATVHEGMGITKEEFDAIATHLDDALETFDVPADERETVLEEIASYEDAIVSA